MADDIGVGICGYQLPEGLPNSSETAADELLVSGQDLGSIWPPKPPGGLFLGRIFLSSLSCCQLQ